jgi:hypothetical protein
MSERLRRLHPRPAKKDTPIRSPLTGVRGAFWMKARRWARIGSGRTCPTPRIVPIKAIWRGSIRKLIGFVLDKIYIH